MKTSLRDAVHSSMLARAVSIAVKVYVFLAAAGLAKAFVNMVIESWRADDAGKTTCS